MEFLQIIERVFSILEIIRFVYKTYKKRDIYFLKIKKWFSPKSFK